MQVDLVSESQANVDNDFSVESTTLVGNIYDARFKDDSI